MGVELGQGGEINFVFLIPLKELIQLIALNPSQADHP
jgi:hypothetical protein